MYVAEFTMLSHGGGGPARATIQVMVRAITLSLLLAASSWAQKAPFDIEALLKVQRIGDPQLSPNGATVAFTVQKVDIENNTKPTHIYVVPLSGGPPRPVSYTHLRAHETGRNLVCRLLLEKKKNQ